MTAAQIVAEVFYSLIGLVFILVGVKALRDPKAEKKITTAAFWFVLAFTFIVGPYLPKWITGACVVIIAVLTAINGVRDSLKWLTANNAIGVSGIVALIVALILFKANPKYAVSDGTRLMDNVGPVGILPQLLSALGALFTAAGVGDVIAKGVSAVIPDGSRLIACAVYCIAMALFTIIMGNGFAAFSVITVGIGIPFLIAQGANPVVVGALGLTAGYCGTLCTPMAANFNIMPAALLEVKNKYAIMLVIHIALMYFFAF